jgi:hypothetical protein
MLHITAVAELRLGDRWEAKIWLKIDDFASVLPTSPFTEN